MKAILKFSVFTFLSCLKTSFTLPRAPELAPSGGNNRYYYDHPLSSLIFPTIYETRCTSEPIFMVKPWNPYHFLIKELSLDSPFYEPMYKLVRSFL